jgi:hypothetical protein
MRSPHRAWLRPAHAGSTRSMAPPLRGEAGSDQRSLPGEGIPGQSLRLWVGRGLHATGAQSARAGTRATASIVICPPESRARSTPARLAHDSERGRACTPASAKRQREAAHRLVPQAIAPRPEACRWGATHSRPYASARRRRMIFAAPFDLVLAVEHRPSRGQLAPGNCTPHRAAMHARTANREPPLRQHPR